MQKPERCEKCGAEPEERKRCPRCGEGEWVLHHGAHYMHGAREVIGCDCPGLHSASGKQMKEAQRQQVQELTGKRSAGRPGKDHPVKRATTLENTQRNTRKLTPEMEARKWKPGQPSPNPHGRPRTKLFAVLARIRKTQASNSDHRGLGDSN